MKRLICLVFLATMIAQCFADAALGQSITKEDVREAVTRKYVIVDALVEESHLTSVGKKSEGMFYKLKCFEILLTGDPMIWTGATGDYSKKAMLKGKRYILILSRGTYWRAEEVGSAGRKVGEVLQWIKEAKAEKEQRGLKPLSERTANQGEIGVSREILKE
jgi:hypothetical protein